MSPFMELAMVALMAHFALARTVRYQIVTHDDGTKEILSNQLGASPSPDVAVLAHELNASLSVLPNSEDENTQQSITSTSNESFTETPSTEKLEVLPLLNQVNTYTTNGWTGQKNSIYANSTKLVIYDDGAETHDTLNNLVKKGRSENLTKTETVLEVPLEQPDVWEAIERLCECFTNSSRMVSAVECLRTRVSSLWHKFMGASEDRVDGKSEKSLVHGKKVLRGALLPLLVLLVIKYLVALPVIAAGLVTIKTFWLSLLSAGVAAFGAPWKHQHIIKRYRPDSDQSWSQPPWTLALHSPEAINKLGSVGSATDKYFM